MHRVPVSLPVPKVDEEQRLSHGQSHGQSRSSSVSPESAERSPPKYVGSTRQNEPLKRLQQPPGVIGHVIDTSLALASTGHSQPQSKLQVQNAASNRAADGLVLPRPVTKQMTHSPNAGETILQSGATCRETLEAGQIVCRVQEGTSSVPGLPCLGSTPLQPKDGISCCVRGNLGLIEPSDTVSVPCLLGASTLPPKEGGLQGMKVHVSHGLVTLPNSARVPEPFMPAVAQAARGEELALGSLRMALLDSFWCAGLDGSKSELHSQTVLRPRLDFSAGKSGSLAVTQGASVARSPLCFPAVDKATRATSLQSAEAEDCLVLTGSSKGRTDGPDFLAELQGDDFKPKAPPWGWLLGCQHKPQSFQVFIRPAAVTTLSPEVGPAKLLPLATCDVKSAAIGARVSRQKFGFANGAPLVVRSRDRQMGLISGGPEAVFHTVPPPAIGFLSWMPAPYDSEQVSLTCLQGVMPGVRGSSHWPCQDGARSTGWPPPYTMPPCWMELC